LVSTVAALAVLGLVLRFLPPVGRNAQANAPAVVASAAPTDLHLGDVLINPTVTRDVLYLDGLVTNNSKAKIASVSAEVDFRDSHGAVVASLEKPLVGISKGGADIVQNEFAANPIKPNEMRFFRIEINQSEFQKIPAAWNHEVPTLKITAVKVR
jgi:hypothetical protein